APHDLQCDSATLSKMAHPLDQFTRVRAVGPDQAQSRPSVGQHFEQLPRAVAVLRGSRRHAGGQQQAERVHEYVPFAPIHILARVIAMLAATVCSLDTLRIKDRRRGLRVAARGSSQPLTQAVMDTFPDALQLPEPEVVIDDSPRRELMWQQAPG